MYGYCCYCRYVEAAIVVAVGARLRLMVLPLMLNYCCFHTGFSRVRCCCYHFYFATADAPGTADAAVVGAIVERHLRSISLASFDKSI